MQRITTVMKLKQKNLITNLIIVIQNGEVTNN